MAFKICVIGCGGIAVRGHGPAYQLYRQTHEGTELAGCCDIDAQRAAHFRERFGFRRAYTDYAEMLAQERPDAVCLVVPVEKTAGLAVSIMKRGYPLLMEKPPGIELCEAELLANAAESCGVPNMVAFNRRHVPLVRILRERMANRVIRHIQCEFCRVGRYDKDFTTTAVHGIDTVGLLAGAPYKEVLEVP